MDGNALYYIIIAILVLQFMIEQGLEYLNAQRYGDRIPKELEDVLDGDGYTRSMEYKKANYRFGWTTALFSLGTTLLFLVFGGFEWVDTIARDLGSGPISMALIFFGIILIGNNIITVPLSYYRTFTIEQRFGFNKSTKKLFWTDLVKGWFLMLVLGGGILALIIWFFQWAGTNFWIYAWAIISVFTLLINLFYSRLIVPLFNKQTPLEEGSLKNKIEDYARQVGFGVKNIFVMDGSKRTTKANAYFSGFGQQKRITLYDTLINELEEDEIVAVLAHEVGHYKRRHVIFNLSASMTLTGFTLFILSLFINNPEMSMAIGVSHPSFHAALIGFGILYSPISEITGLVMNIMSRTFEYQADDFARKTYAAPPLINALKNLSKNSLSNLTPHPAYVFMHYSHPPLIERIRNLKA